ncbi:MAG: rhomboid family intramembrane serine protease [Chloroflexi bacterium]|nr:rhomboid family intramembrane serine protease [Chloroflexota bacterium]
MRDRVVSIVLLLIFVAAIWLVYLVNILVFGGDLNRYGLAPMALPYRFLSEFELSVPYLAGSLRGILLAPLLHGSFSHLMSNTFPLLLLGGFVTLRGTKTLVGLSLFVVVLGGLLVWLVGRPAIHIGASGLVFGYFGYLVAQGWYERSFVSIAVAVAVLLLYGGIIFGVLPQAGFISWEGHLFGLIAGVLAARMGRDGE